MNIVKYLLSRSYRNKTDAEYSKELCDKLAEEQNQMQDIYESISSNKANI